MAKDFVKALTLATRNSNTFNNTFQSLSAGLAFPCFFIRIVNDSDTDITISYDGTTAHDYVPAYSELNLNLQANGQPGNWVALMKKGTPVFVKGAGAGTGSVYLAGYYQEN